MEIQIEVEYITTLMRKDWHTSNGKLKKKRKMGYAYLSWLMGQRIKNMKFCIRWTDQLLRKVDSKVISLVAGKNHQLSPSRWGFRQMLHVMLASCSWFGDTIKERTKRSSSITALISRSSVVRSRIALVNAWMAACAWTVNASAGKASKATSARSKNTFQIAQATLNI